MLRGINLGPHRRVPMAQLRDALRESGYGTVATHLQSGNVVLESEAGAEELGDRIAALLHGRFGLEVPVSVRSHAELAAVLGHDPLPGGAQDAKRYQVTFLPAAPAEPAIARLTALASGAERIAVHRRELYSHHPDGIARSKLAKGLTAPELGAHATVRNWATVQALTEMSAP